MSRIVTMTFLLACVLATSVDAKGRNGAGRVKRESGAHWIGTTGLMLHVDYSTQLGGWFHASFQSPGSVVTTKASRLDPFETIDPGHGKTPLKAVNDLLGRSEGKVIKVERMGGGGRRLIQVPVHLSRVKSLKVLPLD